MKKTIIIAAVTLIILSAFTILLNSIYTRTTKQQTVDTPKETKNQEQPKADNKTLNDFTFKIEEGHETNCITCDISNYDNKKVLYYRQTFELYLCENKDCYTIKDVLDNNMTTLDKIISKAKHKSSAYDGGSTVYYFDKFNIVTCNRINQDNTNTNIYIGNKEILNGVEVCKLNIE